MSCIAKIKIIMKYIDPVFQDLAPCPPPIFHFEEYMVITLAASTGEHGCT